MCMSSNSNPSFSPSNKNSANTSEISNSNHLVSNQTISNFEDINSVWTANEINPVIESSSKTSTQSTPLRQNTSQKPLDRAKSKSNISFDDKKSNISTVSTIVSEALTQNVQMMLTKSSALTTSESDSESLNKCVRQSCNKFSQDNIYVPLVISDEDKFSDDQVEKSCIKLEEEGSTPKNCHLDELNVKHENTIMKRFSNDNSNLEYGGALISSVKSKTSNLIKKNDLPLLHQAKSRELSSGFKDKIAFFNKSSHKSEKSISSATKTQTSTSFSSLGTNNSNNCVTFEMDLNFK